MTRKLKDSGIEWIGKIPENWQIVKGKYLFNKMDRPIEVEETVTAFRDGQVVQRKRRRTDGFTNSLKEIGYQGVRQGDLVIHSMDAFAGAIGISEDDGKCSPVCIVMNKKSDNVNNSYFSYLMRVYSNLGYIESMAKGIRVRSSDFKYNTFANTLLLMPQVTEQENIVDFIKGEMSRADKLITKTKESISELKKYKQSIITEAVTKGLDQDVEMKDSGIEWIGVIPKKWNAQALKYAVSERKEQINNKTDANYELRYVDIGSVSYENGVEKFELMKYKDAPSRARKVVYKNDIIISTVRTYLKSITRITYDNDVIVSTGFSVLIPKEHIEPKILEYICKSDYFTNQVTMLSFGIAYPSITGEKLLSTKIIIPPLEEQIEIISYLDQHTKTIDILVQEKQKMINELERYKKSLIYEYVTGKKEA